jgi:hypothetical protein
MGKPLTASLYKVKKMYMKLKQLVAAACFFIGSLFTNALQAQTVFPPNFEQDVLAEYNALVIKEVTYPKYLNYKRTVFTEQSNITGGITALYNGCSTGNTACGNGDFESGLNTAEWSGAFGSISTAQPNANPAAMTAGFSALNLALGDVNARHTLVSSGNNDPITGVSLVAPGGSTRALRLGNSVDGFGAELISKRITVAAGQTSLSFMYATVLQSPANHNADEQPTFRVRVFDCDNGGQELFNVCNLGNNSNQVIANQANPFFNTITYLNEPLVYTQWLCAQINLSAYIGRTVNIVFINEDCSKGGHFGYTYLDNLCTASNCPTGNISVGRTPACGSGQICFNYTLPQSNGQTGTAQINLNLYQNGALLQTIPGPVLSSGSSYCFTVNPTAIPGINDNLAGYDFSATANFTINGFILAPITTGNPPTGQVAGQNNDVSIYCIDQCCPGRNLVKNPGFELGNQSFTSAYTYTPIIAAGTVTTGRYNTMTSAQGLVVSPTWNVNCLNNGRHLYINGATGQSTPPKLVWRQTMTVSPGKFYKFCFDAKNLPQCGFDVKPRLNVTFSIPGFDLANQLIDVPAGVCNWKTIGQVISVPAGTTSVTIDITLNEQPVGDGNDLALDNMALVEIAQVPQAEVLFNVNFINVTATTFGLSATPVAWPVPSGCGYYWEVEAVMGANNTIVAGTAVYNPSQWWGLYPNTFPGYNGTNVLVGNNPGVFDITKKYRIVYGRWCECQAWNSYAVIVDPLNRTAVRDDKYIMPPAQIAAIIAGTGNVARTAGTEAGTAQKTTAVPAAAKVVIAAMQVYPNPANNNLTVLLPAGNTGGQLVIYDAQGAVINRITVTGKQSSKHIDISALTAGNYVVQFATADGAVTERQKFVKLEK